MSDARRLRRRWTLPPRRGLRYRVQSGARAVVIYFRSARRYYSEAQISSLEADAVILERILKAHKHGFGLQSYAPQLFDPLLDLVF